MSNAEYITKTAEDIVSSLLRDSEKNADDGTEFINSVGTVLNGFKFFLENELKVKYSGKFLKRLHDYSKDIWISEINSFENEEKTKSEIKSDCLYYNYCFEYILKNGSYPL